MAEPIRPSPDALLRQAAREGRGRLKVLLGAAPGVGKTYEMLREGADRLKAGEDVVLALVETHGRADTAALTAPFEIIPRRRIDHGGHALDEMDLDAVLARRPQVALVDELAHTNAPGSRHPKRWQDIEELREAGIDVVTTVNIQHIESLNDVVASFTHVRVKETVPDSVLEDAEIEVVDLPADELIARLKAGKVYRPGEAERALGNFFGKTNLQALRELALRRAAQVVDRQMLDGVEASGAAGQWAAGERLLVALSDAPGTDAVVRAGKRLADAMKAPWTAIVIETPRMATLDDAARQRLADALRLAVTLGATVATVPASTVVEGLKAHVVETRITQLVMGKSRRNWWFELRHGSVVDRLVRELGGVALHIVPLTGTPPADSTRPAAHVDAAGMARAVAVSALTVALGLLVQPWLGLGAIALLFLMPVLLASARHGLQAGLAATVASALGYNFFFIPPVHTFTIADPANLATVLLLAVVAVVVSNLTGRLRQRATIGSRQARENAALATFAQQLAGLASESDTAEAITRELASLFGVRAVLLVPEQGTLRRAAATPPDARLEPIDEASAQWVIDRGTPAGQATDTLAAGEWQFHPLKTSLGLLAVVGIADPDGSNPLPADRALLFTTILGQAALAFERIRLEADARAVAELRSRDELRTTLLASIGHDLRTPLTAIVAAVEQLRVGAADQPGLLDLLHRETRRLARFFADLIDMTRVESRALTPRTEPVDLTDAVHAALADLEAELAGHRVELAIAPELPLVETDPRLLHHMLINLLSNAAAYTPPRTRVAVRALLGADGVTLIVEDEGPGLPPDLAEHPFARFATGRTSDREGGTGLGLAIVKGFADALGITATAANRTGGGAVFELTFPPVLVRAMPEGQPA